MLTNDEFISRCKSKHCDEKGEPLYTYDKCNFNGFDKDHVIITCPKHGNFTLNPRSHFYHDSGCPECRNSYNRIINKQKYDDMSVNFGLTFIEKSKNLHNCDGTPLYLYDKVNYINSYTKVIITCPVHGDFEQSPNSHLSGSGCPECARLRRIKTDYI